MKQILDWLDERTGWRKLKAALLDRKIPKGVNWLYTLGSLLAFLFVLQAVTGILLAMHYSPSPDHAYQSVVYFQNEVFMGRFIRGLHRWGASAMVLVAFLHMLRVYFMAAYKHPREATWLSGVALLLVVVGFGFTGYLLPWDQLAIWAITVGSNMARATPFLGHEGPGQQLLTLGGIDMITNASDARFGLLGARFVGEETLNRFYVLHCIAIPLAAALLIAIHFWRVRKDGGISGPL